MRLFQYAPRFLTPKQHGFTIVELLIVIVVIGILAAVTIVAYNGVTRSAAGATLRSDLRNAQTQLEVSRSDTGSYPLDQDAARDIVRTSDGTLLEYTLGTNTYCVTVSSDAAGTSFYYDKTTNVTAEGACPGHTAGGPFPLVALTSGSSHSCSIAGGAAYCWGLNSNGQLGNNSTDLSSVPVAVSTAGALSGRTVTSISSSPGSSHTCAIADSEAFCWGSNTSGQLGNASTTQSLVPVAVSTAGVLSGRTVTAISAGNAHSCAIADGLAFCWGRFFYGQLGNNAASDSLVPVAVSTAGVLSGRTVTAISAGHDRTCAVADDEAFCWGRNSYGQLGNNGTSNEPVPVAASTAGVLSGRTVTSLSVGSEHTCAIADGAVYCWGRNNFGQLGDGSQNQSLVPVAVSTAGVLSGRTVTSLSMGTSHGCVVADALAFCWGRNFAGQLGNNSTSNALSPVAISTAGVLASTAASLVSTGNAHSCVVADTAGFCTGQGGSGQLGNNTVSDSLVPVSIDPVPTL